MKLSKRLIKNNITQTIIASIVYSYIKFTEKTCRWTVIGEEHLLEELKKTGKVIVAFWHGQLALKSGAWPKKVEGKKTKANTIISAHSDGDFLSKIAKWQGYGLIRGSSGRQQGIRAYKEAIKALKRNESVIITPDGPRGPRMKVKGAIIKIAQATETRVIPLAISVKGAKILDTWDKFMLPLPFSQGVIIYKEAIEVPGDSKQALAPTEKKLEEVLNQATKEADQYFKQSNNK